MRSLFHLLFIPSISLSPLAQSAILGDYTLTYFAQDGQIQIDTLGGNIISYDIQGGAFIPIYHEQTLLNTKISTTTQLSESNFFYPRVGPLNLGRVLQAALTQVQWQDAIQNSCYKQSSNGAEYSFLLDYSTDTPPTLPPILPTLRPETHKLHAGDPHARDRFSNNVALGGGYALVGARDEVDPENDGGMAYL